LLRRATIEMVEVPIVPLVDGETAPPPRAPETMMEDA